MPRSRQQWQYGYQCGLRLNAIHDKMYDKRWLNICHLFGWFSPDKIIQLNFISMFIHWKRSSRSYTLSVRVLHSWFFTWRFADEMAAMASKSFNYQCNFITHTHGQYQRGSKWYYSMSPDVMHRKDEWKWERTTRAISHNSHNSSVARHDE